MDYTGTVNGGVVVLPPEARLADGTEVRVIPLASSVQNNPFLEGMLRLAKPRDWPRDFALNHGHYVKGQPKKS